MLYVALHDGTIKRATDGGATWTVRSTLDSPLALQEVWGPQYERETNYLRSYFAQIHGKLEPDPARPRYFITEARMGYRFSGS